MKEQIYTIPLNEAFDKGGECPFCNLQKKLDEEILNYILGPSYMEEDIREQTNKLGFCKKHYSQIFKAHNRLGAALMIHTHMLTILKDIDSVFDEELSTKQGIFKKKEEIPAEKYISEITDSCYACDRESSRMSSYVYTFFYLWKTEKDFRDKVKNSKGFCLEHLSRIIKDSKKHLNDKNRRELLEIILPMQKENMARIAEDLEWFIKKFDYRYENEPWKNSKDAVERGILKLSGNIEE